MVDLSTLLYPHKCTVSRKTQSGSNAVNQPSYSTSVVTASQACRLEDGGTEERDNEVVLTMEQSTMFFPVDANVLNQDVITAIKKSDDTVIDAGPFEVVKVIQREDAPKASLHYRRAVIQKVP